MLYLIQISPLKRRILCDSAQYPRKIAVLLYYYPCYIASRVFDDGIIPSRENMRSEFTIFTAYPMDWRCRNSFYEPHEYRSLSY
jgi:hypothetical protein